MSTTEHLTQSGEPDMRFKENKEAYGDDNNTYDNNQDSYNRSTSGSQKKDDGPDMRKKENQDGEPYQKEAGQKGGQVRGRDNDYSGSRGQNNQGPSEHLTKDGEPDMRYKENKEAYGQS